MRINPRINRGRSSKQLRCSKRMSCLDCSEVDSNANIKAVLPLEHMDGLGDDDRISELPDDILLTILFQLEMKDAAKTSILSKRWRYLWTNWSDLDFEHSKIIPECHNYSAPKRIDATKYYDWVNQVVSLHSGQSITKFRLQFCFDESQLQDLDRLVEFALSKQVKNLVLEVPISFSICCYTLRPSLLESRDISFLTCLHLTDLNVSGELLEFVLLKCLLLEQLFVQGSRTLVRLKVASVKLKHLTIRYCGSLKEFEIDAVNLRYLYYHGKPTIEFKSFPSSLVEASFGGIVCSDETVPMCQKIACFAMQLSKFSLNVMSVELPELEVDCVICNIPAKGLPCFSNLKYLELTYNHEAIVDLPSITRLLGACPVLCEFKLQIFWTADDIPMEARVLQGLDPLSSMSQEASNIIPYFYDHSMEEEKLEYQAKSLPSMRLFELVGFSGGDDDVNVLLVILDMAVQLHTFICHPLTPNSFFMITEDMAHVCRSRATKLESFVAPKVNNYVISNDIYSVIV